MQLRSTNNWQYLIIPKAHRQLQRSQAARYGICTLSHYGHWRLATRETKPSIEMGDEMYTKQSFKGRWNSIQRKVKDKWSQLSERDLASVEGNLENLIWIVHKRTGASKQDIEDYIDDCFTSPSSSAKLPSQRTRYKVKEETMTALPTPAPVTALQSPESPITNKNRFPSAMDLAATIFSVGFLLGVILGLVMRAAN